MLEIQLSLKLESHPDMMLKVELRVMLEIQIDLKLESHPGIMLVVELSLSI